jgi:hypothetical protein
MKIFELKSVFIDEIPDKLEEGVIYISEKYETAIHLCACGCGLKTVTPLGINGWTLNKINGVTLIPSILITLRPSIGNFAGEEIYHAHYYITNNKIEWL